MIEISSYQNGGYKVQLFDNGTKVRTTLDASKPPNLPEQMDLKITDWCDAGCAWCHEQSTTKGQHADLDKTLKLLSDLPVGAEVAIGGGDPLSHPDFVDFVRALRAQGAIPSVTVNGRHFNRHRDVLEMLTGEKNLFGVGFSYHDELPDWDYQHLVVHLIAGINSPSVMDEAKRRYKLLLLGYKQHGRGAKLFRVRSKEVNDNISQWYRELAWVGKKHHVSFDNLAIEQLNPKRLFKQEAQFEQQYMGAEGLFSMYVDAVTQTYGLSSYDATRYEWSNLKDMFACVRTSQGFEISTESQ